MLYVEELQGGEQLFKVWCGLSRPYFEGRLILLTGRRTQV